MSLAAFHRGGSEHRSGFSAFFVVGAGADQRPDDCAELHRLFLRQVALLEPLDRPVFVLAHDEQVDQANDVVLPEPLELGPDRALELGIAEADDEDLNWAK
jgi:hypothetical protein